MNAGLSRSQPGQGSGTLPLIQNYRAGETLLWKNDGPITQAQFVGSAQALSRKLPQPRYAINLCDDRGNFMHAYAAVLLRGQTNLLPSGRAPGVVRDIARTYPDSYLLCDGPYEDLGVSQLTFEPGELAATPWKGDVPEIPWSHAAAITFTSGSTGGPQPQVKSWRNLLTTAGLCTDRFLGPKLRPPINIVATVPPQHMYGLELSVMLALAGAGATHAARPFFPEDVRAALESVPEPRLLVTTPVHLKSLAASGLKFPPLLKIISATAPLSRESAQQAETALGAPVHEIYGCTEAGSMCTRRTLDGERWHPYPVCASPTTRA